MCDCAEEQQRQAEERKRERARAEERERARARCSACCAARSPARRAAQRSRCGFFTCGLGAGGAGGAGSWLPYAGSAMLLALMVFMLRNVCKHVSKLANMGNLFGSSKTIEPRRRKGHQCDCHK